MNAFTFSVYFLPSFSVKGGIKPFFDMHDNLASNRDTGVVYGFWVCSVLENKTAGSTQRIFLRNCVVNTLKIVDMFDLLNQ